jgi:hypothetical protein
MVMMLVLLELNTVALVTSVPFSVAVNVTDVVVEMLMGEAGLEVIVSWFDGPAVRLIVPETTAPLEDCVAA